jgi:hypothetical protein
MKKGNGFGDNDDLRSELKSESNYGGGLGS